MLTSPKEHVKYNILYKELNLEQSLKSMLNSQKKPAKVKIQRVKSRTKFKKNVKWTKGTCQIQHMKG